MDSAYEIVGEFSQAYPVYEVAQHPDREYRRAVFRREYVLIYRVTETTITFLLAYNTRQNPDDFSLPV